MIRPEAVYGGSLVLKYHMASNHIKALDLVRDGHWDTSHKEIQPYSDELSCLIHAYLHRVEGDFNNAKYWYRRAGQDKPNNSLGEELNRLYRLANADQMSQRNP